MNPFQDAFISYGRADSKHFAKTLNDRLVAEGLTVWFDFDDIPLGVDYQKQIDDGIEKADNFLFVIAPHSINSPYCGLEVELALKRGKRIIPILHVEQISQATWQQRNPQGTEADWEAYKAAGKHSSFPNMHPAIGKINWVYAREGQDDFEAAFQGILQLMQQHRSYVNQHTQVLAGALTWEQNHRQTRYLLVGDACRRAETWLKTRFEDSQPPCLPTDIQCEFITESLKNANNLMTQVFLAYAEEDKVAMQKVRRSFWRQAITVWTNTTDIKTGTDFQEAIDQGIAQADNLVYLLSPSSMQSTYCQHELDYAIALHKRIIPILVRPTEVDSQPPELKGLQYIDLTDNEREEDYTLDESQLLRILKTDEQYYQTHKILLTQALKWDQQHRNPSILLRGYNLRQADTWLKTAKTRPLHQPTDLQVEFITESLRQPPAESLDVFVSYSRADSDFARQLNENLQTYGKLTWFDQESIANASADFEQEIYRGIEVSDNFLFILSPQSVQSPYCTSEVEYAAKLNKRFITILHRAVTVADLHPELAKIQWLDFSQPDHDFWDDFNQLVRVLETDREHVHQHTKWSQRAIEWQEKDRNRDLLLRGTEFAIAEQWLSEATTQKKQPTPTALQTDFIRTSQEAIQAEVLKEKRQKVLLRSLTGVMTGVAILAIGATLWAINSRRQAIISEIDALAATSEAQFTSGQTFDALITALSAEAHLQRYPWAARRDANLPQQVFSALQQALTLGREVNRLEGFNFYVQAVRFSPDGRSLVTVDGKQQIQLWPPDSSSSIVLPLSPQVLSINDLQFSQDGQSIVAIAQEQSDQNLATNFKVYRWDLTGQPLPTVAAEPSFDNMALSPDGETIAAHDGTQVQRWRADGTALGPLPNSSDVGYLEFSQDGQTLVGTAEGQLKLWQQNGAMQAIPTPETVETWFLSPDGAYVMIPDGQTLRLYRADGTLATTLAASATPAETELSYGLFSPDSQMIAVVYESPDENAAAVVKLWNLQGQLLTTFSGNDGLIQNLVFSPDGQTLAIGGTDKVVKLWALDGKLKATLTGHGDNISQITFSPDGKVLASASYDATVRFWAIENPLVEQFNRGQIWLNDDQTHFVSAKAKGSVQLWKRDGTLVATLMAQHPGEQLSVVWSGDGQTLITTQLTQESYGPVQVWNLKGQLIATLIDKTENDNYVDNAGQINSPLTIQMSDDGQTILTQVDSSAISIWNAQGQLIKTLPDQANTDDADRFVQMTARIAADGKTIVTSSTTVSGDSQISYGPVQIWNAQGQLVTTLFEEAKLGSDLTATAVQAQISPDSQTIMTTVQTSKTYGPIQLWDTQGQLMATLIDQTPNPEDSDWAWVWEFFSDDAQQIVTAIAGGSVQVWQRDGTLRKTVIPQLEPSSFPAAYLSPDNQVLVLQALQIDNKKVELWDMNGQKLATISSDGGLTGYTFSPNSQFFALGSYDNSIRLWHRDSNRVFTLTGHNAAVNQVGFDADSAALFSVDEKDNVMVRQVDTLINPDDLVQAGCERVASYLQSHPQVDTDLRLCQGTDR